MTKLKFILFILLFNLLSSFAALANPCVQIYFDRVRPDYWMGKTYSIFTQNLLGHFPNYQQIVSPIELYKAGDIEKCKASIYIGSYFNNSIPESFLKDFISTNKSVAWLGYNIWQLKDSFEKTFGYQYVRQTTLDTDNLDKKDHPTYFKNVYYKGEMFFKYGDWSSEDPNTFLAPFEQSALKVTNPKLSQVLAESQHTFTNEKLPYILQAKNKFYVADVPFSFMHESDRYLIFADILFDLLQEKPKQTQKYAFLRVEDVHPLTSLHYNYDIIKVLLAEKVPINISLIPIFYDPLKRAARSDDEEFVPMTRKVEFMEFIRDLKSKKANFIWHGVTHQHLNTKNPHNGVSGADFEFWDAILNKPLKMDSSEFVLNKLDDGRDVLEDADIFPKMWLTPHYQASPLDYLIFGKVFPWNVGRVIYYNHRASGLQSLFSEKDLWYTTNNSLSSERRKLTFKNVNVLNESERWNGQFFPYPIFGDVYGQRLIPENLGNSQPFVGEFVPKARSVEEIVADAKRNRVLRDTWASFFYHPFLLAPYEDEGRGSYAGDPAELLYIVQNLKKLGYQFLDINQFMNQSGLQVRPEPIYKELNQ